MNALSFGANNGISFVRPWRMMFRLCLAVFSISGVFCSPQPLIQFASIPDPQMVMKEAWRSFDAFYELDESAIVADYKPLTNEWISEKLINKWIKIVTTEGASFATVPIPKYSNKITQFKIILIDSSGSPVQIDIDEIRKEYLSSEKVVVPQATAGCRIGIYIRFKKAPDIPISIKHQFRQNIPVAKSRFIFISKNLGQYAWKIHDSVKTNPKTRLIKGSTGPMIWSRENIEPIPKDSYVPLICQSIPNLSIALIVHPWSNLTDQTLKSWDGLARLIREEIASATIPFLNDLPLPREMKTSIGKNPDSLEKAREIVQWVNANLSFKESKIRSTDFGKCLKRGAGNQWDIPMVLNEILNHFDLKSEILLTCPENSGGFDPSFVSFQYADIPLVITTIQGRRYCTYPFENPLFGQYPKKFMGQAALNVKSGQIEQIPPPIYNSFITASKLKLDLSRPSDQYFHLENFSLAALAERAEIQEGNENLKEEYGRKILKHFDEFNELKEIKIRELHMASMNFGVDMTFAMKRDLIKQGNASIFIVNDFAKTVFHDLDGKRKLPFKTYFPRECRDTFEFMKPAGKTIKTDFKCAAIANKLFRSSCTSTETDSSFILARHIVINSIELTAGEINALYPDIQNLNALKTSTITMK
jgi:hypothetical protein